MTTALEGGEGSASRPGRSLPPGKDAVTIVQEAGWAPGPVWTGAENLAPTGIRSPDRPGRSQSLYPTTLPGPLYEYDLPHIKTTAGNGLLYCQTCRILGERIIKKNCFKFLSRNFQYCTPDVYFKFVFCLLKIVTISYLVSYLKVLLVAKIVECQ